jgi:hypothetical protein
MIGAEECSPLLLGSDAVHFASMADAAREASGKLWRAVSLATDFAAAGPIPALPEARTGDPSQWTVERQLSGRLAPGERVS